MAIQLTLNPTRDGTAAVALIPGGPGVADRRASAHVRFEHIAGALQNAGDRIPVLQETFTDAAMVEQIRKMLVPVEGMVASEISTGREKRRQFHRAMADHTAIPASIDRSWFQWTVDRVLAMSMGDRAKFLKTCGPAVLAALLDAGNDLLGLAPHEWDMVQERAVLAFFAERQGLAARHPLAPTLDNLFAVGADASAVEDAARTALDGMRASQAALDADEQSLAQIIILLAVMTDRKPAEQLDRVLAA